MLNLCGHNLDRYRETPQGLAATSTLVRSDQTPESAETTALLTDSLCPAVERCMRVGIYARVSTKDQSCEMQLRDLRAYCIARQLSIVREYVDTGQSGTKDSRPQLNELMDDARKRKLDAVLVWRFDRFARSTRHLLVALEEFRGLGVGFVSYMENIETSTPLGQALFTIIAAVAELERNLIVERVCAGIRNAKSNGKRLGRPRQYVDLDRIRDMRAAGMSLRQVADKLALGYGTVRTALESSERKTQASLGAE
jgi:DNA invertase Pin-like site-specific DNA recombinase